MTDKTIVVTPDQKKSAKGFRATATALGGAVCTLIVWMLNRWLDAGITAEIAGVLQIIVVFAVIVFIPSEWWVKYQQIDDGGDQ